MEQNHECKFCNTRFHKEITLTTHMCVKKRRYMEAGTPGSRFGLRAFQRFYELTANSKKAKTQDEFINSPYYIDFVKFGHHLATLKPVYLEKYIDYVIMNGVKLKDWTKDFVYDLYIEDILKKEPAASAAERTITEMVEWCENNDEPFTEFFSKISANEASHLVRSGRLSPWVLYLSATGGDLMDKFNDDHAKMIGAIIEPGFWMKKFKKAGDDVDFIKDLLGQAGL